MAIALVTDWFVEEMIDSFKFWPYHLCRVVVLYGCGVIRMDKKNICCKSMVYVTFVDTEGVTYQQ